MARETLPVALDLMFGSEGGYSNSKSDSGGPTKYGVTHKTLAAHRGVASVTAAQVKAMTLQEATEIYERYYWSQSGGDVLPVGLDYAAFDFGVNSGPTTAVKKLKKVLGIRQDAHHRLHGHHRCDRRGRLLDLPGGRRRHSEHPERQRKAEQ